MAGAAVIAPQRVGGHWFKHGSSSLDTTTCAVCGAHRDLHENILPEDTSIAALFAEPLTDRDETETEHAKAPTWRQRFEDQGVTPNVVVMHPDDHRHLEWMREDRARRPWRYAEPWYVVAWHRVRGRLRRLVRRVFDTAGEEFP